MKIACFVVLDECENVSKMGYDFIETRFTSVESMTDDEILEMKKRLDKLKLPCLTACSMIPAEMKVIGKDVDFEKIETFLQKGFANAQKLGIKTVVFGSGKSRFRDDDIDEETAYLELVKVGKFMANIAEKYDIVITLENLNASETNTLNFTKDCAKIVREVDSANFKLLYDYYHAVKQNESLDVLDEVADILHHVHFARPSDRSYTDLYCEDEQAFVQKLAQINYTGILTTECFVPLEVFREKGEVNAKILKEYITKVK